VAAKFNALRSNDNVIAAWLVLSPRAQGRYKLSAMDRADLLRDLGAILRDVAFREILPRFRALAASEVHSKGTTDDPDDLVTSADHAAEEVLLASLPALVRGSRAIGEEGAAADPSQLERLREDAPVWIVDPLDGTRNFAAGREPFGPRPRSCITASYSLRESCSRWRTASSSPHAGSGPS
jgi:hypothetical protein